MEINFRDPQLAPLWDKVQQGERLTLRDGLALYTTDDLIALGKMAHFVQQQKSGDAVYFVVNRKIEHPYALRAGIACGRDAGDTRQPGRQRRDRHPLWHGLRTLCGHGARRIRPAARSEFPVGRCSERGGGRLRCAAGLCRSGRAEGRRQRRELPHRRRPARRLQCARQSADRRSRKQHGDLAVAVARTRPTLSGGIPPR